MDDNKIGAEKVTLVTKRPAIEGSPFQSADDTWLQPDPNYPAHALDPETKKPLCPHSDPITVLPSATWPPPGIRKCPRCVEEVAMPRGVTRKCPVWGCVVDRRPR